MAEAFERERRFAGEASHQLRTPLTALIGQVEVALRREREPAEYRRALASVLDQAGRLRRVVEALLFLARSEADARPPGVERIDLAAWAADRLRARADGPRAGDLAFETPAVAVPAAAHPDLLGELLDALIDNTLKYSEPGTPVAVRVGRDRGGVWAEVEDRGCGIAPRRPAAPVPPVLPVRGGAAARRAGRGPGIGRGAPDRGGAERLDNGGQRTGPRQPVLGPLTGRDRARGRPRRLTERSGCPRVLDGWGGVTDTCGMGMLLARMPWNRVAPTCGVTADAGGAR